ncbi:MAG: glycosyltransferase family 4 protein [Patescibacteria group bacterium]
MISQNFKIGLFPLHTFVNPGGVKRHVLAVHKEFRDLGYSSLIAPPRRNKSEQYGEGIELFGRSRPLFSNGSEGDFTFCSGKSAESFLTRHNFDIIHFHNFGWHSFQILKKSKAVNVLSFHANINLAKWGFFKLWPRSYRRFKKIINQNIDGIIAPSTATFDNFSDFPGTKAVIPNGVDLSRFFPAPKALARGQAPDYLTILFLGRLEERKGLIYLLRAYQLLKQKYSFLRLVIAGDGPEREKCEEFVEARKLADVFFDGQMSEELVPIFYRSCDIFVSPAVFGESFGMVLLEAMACGKPVVAFANEGYKEVLTGKGAEFLVEPKNWQELAEKIEILITSEQKRGEMGQWGIEQSKKYSWEVIAQETLSFYKRAAEWREKKRFLAH